MFCKFPQYDDYVVTGIANFQKPIGIDGNANPIIFTKVGLFSKLREIIHHIHHREMRSMATKLPNNFSFVIMSILLIFEMNKV